MLYGIFTNKLLTRLGNSSYIFITEKEIIAKFFIINLKFKICYYGTTLCEGKNYQWSNLLW